MDLEKAEELALQLMRQHNLINDNEVLARYFNWKFEFDNAKSRFGLCQYGSRTISLSAALTRLNGEDAVKNTLLHEIAHAIVGPGHGHNRTWKTQARAIGCDGKRCYSSTIVEKPKGKWRLVCPNCQREYFAHRLSRRGLTACKACCDKYNHGRFDHRFVVSVSCAS